MAGEGSMNGYAQSTRALTVCDYSMARANR